MKFTFGDTPRELDENHARADRAVEALKRELAEEPEVRTTRIVFDKGEIYPVTRLNFTSDKPIWVFNVPDFGDPEAGWETGLGVARHYILSALQKKNHAEYALHYAFLHMWEIWNGREMDMERKRILADEQFHVVNAVLDEIAPLEGLPLSEPGSAGWAAVMALYDRDQPFYGGLTVYPDKVVPFEEQPEPREHFDIVLPLQVRSVAGRGVSARAVPEYRLLTALKDQTVLQTLATAIDTLPALQRGEIAPARFAAIAALAEARVGVAILNKHWW